MLHTDYPGARDTDGREIGSVENLNVNTLNKFDLVLCGHIHKPLKIIKEGLYDWCSLSTEKNR